MQLLPVLAAEGCRASMPPHSRTAKESELLATILQEQRELSAVEVFSNTQGNGEFPIRTERYHALLPATSPGPGQQYAFDVDLDRCSGCKACVAACHALNGLDEQETWRSVGLLIGGSRSAPVMQHVTAACHHCMQPACMIACPVNAYEKDSVTGIVKHLDDQCFGCQYCTLACPYEVPKYHPAKGIVRKCDMCASRLAVGEAPACVQSCPHEAICISVVNQQQVLDDVEAAIFLPAAPDPQITLPTTTYRTKKVFPRNLLPVDYFSVSAQHAHMPLVIMLVLTQLSVGAFLVGLVLERVLPTQLLGTLRSLLAVNALGFGLLALGASVFHLGRPRYAFRAVLGLRHSWLSREIVAFGAFALLASVYAGVLVWLPDTAPELVNGIGVGVGVSGLIAVLCSIMIYVFVRRENWSFERVAIRFLLTAGVLGVAVVWLSILVASIVQPSSDLNRLVYDFGPGLCVALLTLAFAKLIWEAALFRHLMSRQMSPLKRSALLMTGELANITLARFASGFLGGLLMPMLLLSFVSTAPDSRFVIATAFVFLACLAGELLERYLFFAACAAPRMPGSIC